MADINAILARGIGNSLVAGAGAGSTSARGRQIVQEEEGRKEVAPLIPKALAGDAGAMGQIAARSPQTAAGIAPILARLDASQAAKVKEAADYTVRLGTGLLTAPPEARAQLYAQERARATAEGKDTASWPETYNEGWVKFNVGKGVEATKWFQEHEKDARKAARGGGPQVIEYSPFSPAPGAAAPPGRQSAVAAPPGPVVADAAPSMAPGAPPSQGSPVAPQMAAAPPIPASALVAPQALPQMAQAPAVPPGFQAMGHRNPQGQLVPAMFSGQPVYRNQQTGDLVSADKLPQVAPTVQIAQAPQIAQGDAGSGEPGDMPAQAPVQTAQAQPPRATTGPAAVATPPATFQQPWEADPQHPFNGGGKQLMTIDRKSGAQVPIIADGKEVFRMPNGAVIRYEFKATASKPATEQRVDVLGPDGVTLIGQRDPKTNAFHPIAPAKQAPDAKFTEGQAASALYADRMQSAEKLIRDNSAAGLNPRGKVLESVPLVGNYFQTNEYQQLEQARRDFINAVLRRESGAVISDAEFANAEKQYFPRPGDKPDVLRNKEKNRQVAIEGLIRAAGPAYSKPASDPAASPAEQARDKFNADKAPAGGVTATNPKTGEKVILRDGKWEPLK